MRKFVGLTGVMMGAAMLLSACVTTKIPTREYALAKAAQDAAITAEAAKFAPQMFYKADKAYKKAEQLYKDRYYEEATQAFLVSQKLSEKAETEARLKQFSSGENQNENGE